MLGKPLSYYFKLCKKRFSKETVVKIAIKLIDAIEAFHKSNYVHRDVKPGNFVFGPNNDFEKIYIIDFGLSQ